MKLKQQEAKESAESKWMLEVSSRFEEKATEIKYAMGTQVPSKIFSFKVFIVLIV